MPILTLTTDFGTNNFYLASFKGLVLRNLSSVQIVDISHTTDVFDLQSSAFQVQNCWKNFPKHTVHFIRVGEQYAPRHRFLACQYQNQFFVLPDNGLITLIIQDNPDLVVQIEHQQLPTQLSETLAQVIAQILQQQSLDGVGAKTNQFVERLTPQPITNQNIIRGAVQYIDRYGNLITNITQELFEANRQGRNFDIISRSEQFNQIDNYYHDVAPSEKVAFFNAFGYLQLSINEGNAAQLLGLTIGSQIQIEFYD